MYNLRKYLFTENFSKLVSDPTSTQLLMLCIYEAGDGSYFDPEEVSKDVISSKTKLNKSLKTLEELGYLEKTRNRYKLKYDLEKRKYSEFIDMFNKITGRSFRGDSKSQGHFNARIREGYTFDELVQAVKRASQDDFLKENGKYLTPEYVTRPSQLEKWLNAEEMDDSMDYIVR